MLLHNTVASAERIASRAGRVRAFAPAASG
jgi:hypothetical protein